MNKAAGHAEHLEGIRRALEDLGDTARKALAAVPRPESRFKGVLKMAVLAVGALGVIHTADVMRRWFMGG